MSIATPEFPLVALAVSGGADSMALFYRWLDRGEPFTVLHFNHAIAGELGDEEEAFVRTCCTAHGVPCIVERNIEAPPPHASREMAARSARLNFFARCVAKYGFTQIVTAHHADDVAEHVLMRFARGSGARGLSALKPYTTLVIQGVALYLHRPFVEKGVCHAELVAELKAHNRAWREDVSNTDTTILRNQIRSILPALNDAISHFTTGLAQSAEILREEDEYLADVVASLKLDLTGSLVLPDVHLALQRRIVAQWLAHQGITSDFALIEALCRGEGRWNDVRRVGRRLEVVAADVCVKPDSIVIDRAGCYHFGIFQIDVTAMVGFLPARSDFVTLPQKPLLVRARQDGDRFTPIHGVGSRKVQDVLVDMKYPVEKRDLLPLFYIDDELAWIPGCRVGTIAQLTPSEPSWGITLQAFWSRV